MPQSQWKEEVLIQKGLDGVFNLFKLGNIDKKYHFIRVVTEIPSDWKYNPPLTTGRTATGTIIGTIEEPVSNIQWDGYECVGGGGCAVAAVRIEGVIYYRFD